MAKEILYTTSGTCSKTIELALDDEGRISRCHIEGGCPGYSLGLSRLVVGMKPADIIERFRGLRCGKKPTSCPDQLSLALEQLERQP